MNSYGQIYKGLIDEVPQEDQERLANMYASFQEEKARMIKELIEGKEDHDDSSGT